MNIKSYRTLEPIAPSAPPVYESPVKNDSPFDKYFPIQAKTRAFGKGGCVILQGGHKVFAPTAGADLRGPTRNKDVRLRFLEFIEKKQRAKAELRSAPVPICQRMTLQTRPSTSGIVASRRKSSLHRQPSFGDSSINGDLKEAATSVFKETEDIELNIAASPYISEGRVLFHAVVFPQPPKRADTTPGDLTTSSPAHSITPNHSRKNSSMNATGGIYPIRKIHSRSDVVPELVSEEINQKSPMKGPQPQQAQEMSRQSSQTSLVPIFKPSYTTVSSPYKAPEFRAGRMLRKARYSVRRNSIEPEFVLNTIRTLTMQDSTPQTRRNLKGKKLRSKRELTTRLNSMPTPSFQNAQLAQYMRTQPPATVNLESGLVSRSPSIIIHPRPNSGYTRHFSKHRRDDTNTRKALMILQSSIKV